MKLYSDTPQNLLFRYKMQHWKQLSKFVLVDDLNPTLKRFSGSPPILFICTQISDFRVATWVDGEFGFPISSLVRCIISTPANLLQILAIGHQSPVGRIGPVLQCGMMNFTESFPASWVVLEIVTYNTEIPSR